MTLANLHQQLDYIRVAIAFTTLTQVVQTDPTYAWAWQCALVESQWRAGVDPQVAHQAAASFLYQHFGVDITLRQEYRDLRQGAE